MKRKRRIYVLWFESDGGEGGWPTLNNTEERLPNVFEKLREAREALKAHNEQWPENADEMSVKTFEEVSR